MREHFNFLYDFLSTHRPAHISWRRLAAIVTATAIGLTVISITNTGRLVEDYIARKLDFWARDQLEMPPKLHSDLKIFIYDDPAVSRFESTDVSPQDWQRIFAALDKANPRLIMVDKLFDLMDKQTAEELTFPERIANLSTPVIAGAFVTDQKIPFRESLTLDGAPYRIRELSKGRPPHPVIPPPNQQVQAYGAPPEIGSGFAGKGHLVYRGAGKVKPFHRVGPDRVIPHWSLFAADDLQVDAEGLTVDGTRVGLTPEHAIPVNIGSFEQYLKRSYGMKALVLRARRGKPIPVVDENDVVVILPAMYTGHTDWVSTPLGQMPGGFVVTALINSVLTKNWLTPMPYAPLFVIGGCIIGGVIGATLWGIIFALVLTGTLVTILLLGTGGFVLAGVITPWFYPLLGCALTSGSVLAERARRTHVERIRIEEELKVASIIQKTFFPRQIVREGDLRVVGRFEPATECSGDWWGHFIPDEGLEYVMVGDAMGHGVPAALVTGMAYSSFMAVYDVVKEGVAKKLSPAQILGIFNRVIYSALEGDMSMTFFIALFDTKKGTMTYANAGHQFPVFFPARPNDDRFRARKNPYKDISPINPVPLTARGTVLGMEPDTVFRDHQTPIVPGDKLLLFSDGILECKGADGQAWSRKAMTGKALSLLPQDASGMVDGLAQAFRERLDTVEADDDVTVIVAEIPDLQEAEGDDAPKKSA